MKYNCPACKYTGDDSGNWTRHIKSKKHLKNVENEEKTKKVKDDTKLKVTRKLPKITRTSKKLPENFG